MFLRSIFSRATGTFCGRVVHVEARGQADVDSDDLRWDAILIDVLSLGLGFGLSPMHGVVVSCVWYA